MRESLGYDLSGRRSRERLYRVVCSDATDGLDVAATASGLPAVGSAYPNLLMVANSVSGSVVDGSRTVFEFVVSYSNEVSNEDRRRNPTDNPDLEPASFQWDSGDVAVPLEKDLDNKPVLNAAGQQFDPPVMVSRSRPSLIITRNESTWDGSKALEYVDTVNSSSFYGADKGTVRCVRIQANSSYRKGVSFFVIRYEFSYKSDGWQPEPLNAGYYERNTDRAGNFKLQRIQVDGQDTVVPQLLNKDGKAFTDDEKRRPSFTPVYLKYKGYPIKDFNQLGFGPISKD
jgi:hypothetical protein